MFFKNHNETLVFTDKAVVLGIALSGLALIIANTPPSKSEKSPEYSPKYVSEVVLKENSRELPPLTKKEIPNISYFDKFALLRRDEEYFHQTGLKHTC